MGSVIVFTRCPLMPEFCLITSVSNTVGINNRTSLSTRVPLIHTLIVWPRTAFVLQTTHNCSHPQKENKRLQTKSLMATLFRKGGEHLKRWPFQRRALGIALDHSLGPSVCYKGLAHIFSTFWCLLHLFFFWLLFFTTNLNCWSLEIEWFVQLLMKHYFLCSFPL